MTFVDFLYDEDYFWSSKMILNLYLYLLIIKTIIFLLHILILFMNLLRFVAEFYVRISGHAY